MIRWLSTYLLPEVYARLLADKRKSCTEGSSQSYFLAGIESRALESFAQFRTGCSTEEGGCAAEHMGLQFDGPDVLTRRVANNSQSSAQEAIFRRVGYSVNLAEKHHPFFIDNVVKESTSSTKTPAPPSTPALYDDGKCVLLAMRQLPDSIDVYDAMGQIARGLQ